MATFRATNYAEGFHRKIQIAIEKGTTVMKDYTTVVMTDSHNAGDTYTYTIEKQPTVHKNLARGAFAFGDDQDTKVSIKIDSYTAGMERVPLTEDPKTQLDNLGTTADELNKAAIAANVDKVIAEGLDKTQAAANSNGVGTKEITAFPGTGVASSLSNLRKFIGTVRRATGGWKCDPDVNTGKAWLAKLRTLIITVIDVDFYMWLLEQDKISSKDYNRPNLYQPTGVVDALGSVIVEVNDLDNIAPNTTSEKWRAFCWHKKAVATIIRKNAKVTTGEMHSRHSHAHFVDQIMGSGVIQANGTLSGNFNPA